MDKILRNSVTKQKYDEEETPFTSSLNICLEACCRNGWGREKRVTPPDLWFEYISFKDDVTVILLLGVSFMNSVHETQRAGRGFESNIFFLPRKGYTVCSQDYMAHRMKLQGCKKYRMRKVDKCCAEVIYDQIRKRGMENVPFVTIMTSRQCTAHCSDEKIRKEGPLSTTA